MCSGSCRARSVSGRWCWSGSKCWRRARSMCRGSCWARSWRCTWLVENNVIHIHSCEITKAILVHEELNAHGLTRIWRHIHRLIDPLSAIAQMEDRLQDVAGAIGYIGVLPIECDGVCSAVLVPETQYAGAAGHGELLVEGAVPGWLGSATAKGRCRIPPSKCGKRPCMRKRVGDYRRVVGTINHPGWKAPGLESAVLNYTGIASRRGCCWCRR